MLRRVFLAVFPALALPAACATVDATGGTYNDLGTAVDAVISDATDDAGLPVADVPAMPDVRAGDAGIDATADARPDVALDVAPADAGPCATGSTRACYTGAPGTRGVGFCADGFQRCTGGVFSGACNGQNLPQTEVCNGIDDDCNHVADDIPAQSCYTGPPASRNAGICHDGSLRCEGTMTICAGQVVPQTAEICGNHLDDNCNGQIDEGC